MEDFFEDDFKRGSEGSTSLNETNQMRTPSVLSMEQSPYVPGRAAARCREDLSGFIKDIRQERASAARLDARLTYLQQRLATTESDQPTARSALKTERGSFDKGNSYTKLNQHFRAMYRTPSAGLKLKTERETMQGPVRAERPSSICGVDLSMVSKGEVTWLQSREDVSKFIRAPSVPRHQSTRTSQERLSFHHSNSIWPPHEVHESLVDLTSTLLKPEKQRSLSTQRAGLRPVASTYQTDIVREIEDFQRSVAYLRKAVLGQEPNPALLQRPPVRAELERRYLALVRGVESASKELAEVRFQNILLVSESMGK